MYSFYELVVCIIVCARCVYYLVCTSCMYQLYILFVCTSYVPVVLNSCMYILVFNNNYVLDVYSSCMFYIVLFTCSMNL